jgi:squalene-hopene cyclase-like protein/prenyltransferase/squalene oxidase-like repeat protein
VTELAQQCAEMRAGAGVSPGLGRCSGRPRHGSRVAVVAACLAATALALLATAASAPAAALDGKAATAFLVSSQRADGGFGEPGRQADPSLTAWVVLALAASGRDPVGVQNGGNSPADYLAGKPYPTATDLELRILALDALGRRSAALGLADRLEDLRRSTGAIGPGVNSTIWGIIALRTVGRPAGSGAVGYLLRQQRPNGGWSWAAGIAPDSNDTAAAIQALRASGVSAGSRAIRRGLAYLASLRNSDGGFELTANRGSDTQSTAWAIQAYAAVGRKAPQGALAYLARLQRPNGSYRYSARYVTTPVWVTSNVLPALARRAFPL